ncbi:MAG: 4Fe-4S cluster-binding domain-containing protein [Desulfosalsimonadaceae bacterium]
MKSYHPNNQPNNNQATILEIVRMSTEDGPGIRTTVFFKGCPLQCAWCHNPESISVKPQLWWIGSRCIGCREELREVLEEWVLFRVHKNLPTPLIFEF